MKRLGRIAKEISNIEEFLSHVEVFVPEQAVMKINQTQRPDGLVLYCTKVWSYQGVEVHYGTGSGEWMPRLHLILWLVNSLHGEQGQDEGVVHVTEITLERYSSIPTPTGFPALECINFALLRVNGDSRLCMIRV